MRRKCSLNINKIQRGNQNIKLSKMRDVVKPLIKSRPYLFWTCELLRYDVVQPEQARMLVEQRQAAEWEVKAQGLSNHPLAARRL